MGEEGELSEGAGILHRRKHDRPATPTESAAHSSPPWWGHGGWPGFRWVSGRCAQRWRIAPPRVQGQPARTQRKLHQTQQLLITLQNLHASKATRCRHDGREAGLDGEGKVTTAAWCVESRIEVRIGRSSIRNNEIGSSEDTAEPLFSPCRQFKRMFRGKRPIFGCFL